MKKIQLLILLTTLLFIPVAGIADVHTQKVSPVSLVKPYKDISHRILTVNKLKKRAQDLSEGDKSIIQKYVFGAVSGEDTFTLMNAYLRGNLNQYIKQKDITKPLQMRMKYYSDNLCKTLSKTELPQNMILYGNTNIKDLSVFFPDKTILNILNKPFAENNLSVLSSKLTGKQFTDKGFIITYYDQDYIKNPNVILEIRAPKNLQGVLLLNSTKYEKAVLLNKGTAWKVTGISSFQDKNTKKNYYKISIKFVI